MPGESTPDETVTDTKPSVVEQEEDQPQAGDTVAVPPTPDSPGPPSGEEEAAPVEPGQAAAGEQWENISVAGRLLWRYSCFI